MAGLTRGTDTNESRTQKLFFFFLNDGDYWSSPTESASDFLTISKNRDKTKSGWLLLVFWRDKDYLLYSQRSKLDTVQRLTRSWSFRLKSDITGSRTNESKVSAYKVTPSPPWTTFKFEPQGRVGQTLAKLGGLAIFEFKNGKPGGQ